MVFQEVGASYYRRVIDDETDQHATTMSTYTCENASYSGTGWDELSSDCSTAWYGGGAPDITYLTQTIDFKVEGAEGKLTVTLPPSVSADYTTTYDNIVVTYEHSAENTQVVRINGASAIVTHGDLKSGHIRYCKVTTSGESYIEGVKSAGTSIVDYNVVAY